MNSTYIEQQIRLLLQKGNLAKAEIFLRKSMSKEPENPIFPYYLGEISKIIGMRKFAINYFKQAEKLQPSWEAPQENLKLLYSNVSPLQKKKPNNFLLIKAWGYGFWSDIFHVLGMLLLAEISERTPIIHWGTNSLFGSENNTNAFNAFFEPVSNHSINDIQNSKFSFFPSKWNKQNLLKEDINKWSGLGSRMASIYLLNRPEKVIVSDFYSSVIDIHPWISTDHPLHNLSIDQLYDYLIKKYLKPKSYILEQVKHFQQNSLQSGDYISVHMRGSDKITEVPDLDALNKEYFKEIDQQLQTRQDYKIFLMTDDNSIKETFYQRYGERTKVTDCQRTSDNTGIHYYQNVDKKRLGIEVMVDTYIAAQGEVIIGNARSNPSLIVRYLKGWNNSNVKLLGHSMLYESNVYLHNW